MTTAAQGIHHDDAVKLVRQMGFVYDPKRSDWVREEDGVRGRLAWVPVEDFGDLNVGARFWLQQPRDEAGAWGERVMVYDGTS
jgi:hypothetical protein